MRTALGCVAIAIYVAVAIASTPFAHSAESVERGVDKQYAAVATVDDLNGLLDFVLEEGRTRQRAVDPDGRAKCCL